MRRLDRTTSRRVCATALAVETTGVRSLSLPTLSIRTRLGVSRTVDSPDTTIVETTQSVVALDLGNEVVLPRVAGNPEECIT
jgi:hypothetical protein